MWKTATWNEEFYLQALSDPVAQVLASEVANGKQKFRHNSSKTVHQNNSRWSRKVKRKINGGERCFIWYLFVCLFLKQQQHTFSYLSVRLLTNTFTLTAPLQVSTYWGCRVLQTVYSSTTCIKENGLHPALPQASLCYSPGRAILSCRGPFTTNLVRNYLLLSNHNSLSHWYILLASNLCSCLCLLLQ